MSESRVRVDHETEEAPVNDGEVGEADVVGEFDEPEEPGASGELGEAGDGAADAAATADDPSAVAGDEEAVADDADAVAGDRRLWRRPWPATTSRLPTVRTSWTRSPCIPKS